LIFVGLYRWFPEVRDALAIVKPDTVDPLASCGVQSLLTLEVEVWRRAAEGAAGDTSVDPVDP
jgi:hypothetical protein